MRLWVLEATERCAKAERNGERRGAQPSGKRERDSFGRGPQEFVAFRRSWPVYP